MLMPSAKQRDCVFSVHSQKLSWQLIQKHHIHCIVYYLKVFAYVGNDLGQFSVKLWLNFLAGCLPRATTSTPPFVAVPIYISECRLSNDHETPATVNLGHACLGKGVGVVAPNTK